MTKLADAKTPLDTLVALCEGAPDSVSDLIQSLVMEVLLIELPKLKFIADAGPAISRDEMKSIRDTFEGAMNLTPAKEHSEARRLLTATVLDASLDIGSAIDKAISRTLLEDKRANRLAFMDIMALHARLSRAIAELALTEEQNRELDRKAS